MTGSVTSPRRRSARPALLVFTVGPKAEQRRRALLPAREGRLEQELHGGCLLGALAAGRTAGCRLLVSSPTPIALPPDVESLHQPGHGFGERLRRAVAEARERVAGPILIVPGDVPGLRGSHLEEALASLRDDPRRVVVGPDRDGGIYLLGACGVIDDLIARVSWQRRTTRGALEHACAEARRPVVRLAVLGDLDRRSDLTSWLARVGRVPMFAGTFWHRLISRLLVLNAAVCRPVVGPAWVAVESRVRVSLPSRGPPRC